MVNEARVTAGGKPGLTLAVIVSTAIEVADDGGLDAVTMRRVGAKLDATGMALYRHVANREALIELMIDHVVAEFSDHDERLTDWRAVLESVARQEWRSYLAHPWVLAATAAIRPPMGPNMLASMEWALSAFDGLGLPARDQLHLVTTVTSHGQGLALNWTQGSGPADDWLGTAEWWRDRLDDANNADRDVRYSRLAVVTTALSGDHAAGPGHDEEFEFGLRRILDGIALYLDGR